MFNNRCNCCHNCCCKCCCNKKENDTPKSGGVLDTVGLWESKGFLEASALSRLRGPQGPTGPTGPAGARGATGMQGVTGLKGTDGITPKVTVAGTITGEPGTEAAVVETFSATGASLLFTIPAGKDGANAEIAGSYDNIEDLEKEHPEGKPGEMYLVNGILYVWDSKNKKWVAVGNLQGPTGPAGPAAAMIPFALCKHGAYLGCGADGKPSYINFAGFGMSTAEGSELEEGEWDSGIITVQSDSAYMASFITTYDAKLKKIYAIFSPFTYDDVIVEKGRVYPFVCIGVSSGNELAFKIIPETIVRTEPYLAGVKYSQHSLKRATLLNLDIDIPEGTLVAIMVGIMGEGTTDGCVESFLVSGGVHFE